jgi:hypothetical protein
MTKKKYGQKSIVCEVLSGTRTWKLEIRNWKMETGRERSQFPFSDFQFLLGVSLLCQARFPHFLLSVAGRIC